MNSLLAKFLRKKGIESVKDLNPEEKATFERYQSILAKKDLSLDDLRQFIKARIDHIEMKWKDMNIEQSKKAELVPYYTVYKTLLQAIEAPIAEREALEQILIQQIQ